MSNALDRGLDLLEILASRGEARVAELVDALEVSRATVFRIMVTLEGRGFVEHVPERHTWRLGRTVAELAATIDSDEIAKLASATLSDLAERTQETINLVTVHRNRAIWTETIDSPHALRMTTTIGDHVIMHTTAVGKAILSTFPDEDWHRFLPSEPLPGMTENSRRTIAELAADIEHCRTTGWALDDEESELNAICLAAPIVDSRGRAVAAISISSTSGRLPPSRRGEWGELVRQRCEHISQQLNSGRA